METFIALTGTENVSQRSWALWVLFVGVTVAACGTAVVRVIPRNQRLVVFRSGHVRRVAGPGLTTRVPLLDQVLAVSLDPVDVQVVAHAQSREGVCLVAWGTAELQVVEPSLVHHADGDPIDAAVELVEAAIAARLSHASMDDLDDVQNFVETGLSGGLSAACASWGVEVTAVQISEVDARLGGHRDRDRRRHEPPP